MVEFHWKPLRLLGNVDEQIDQAFDKLIHHPWGLSASAPVWQPDIDIYETADAYLVEVDVPGVSLDKIKVDVNDHWLKISGTRQSAGLSKSAQGVRIERRTGSFSRQFYLESAIDPSQVQREHQEGTLRLKLTKRKGPGQQS